MTITTELLDVAGTPVSDWPEELRQQVEGNPELLRDMNEQARMASLMALKRHEKPDPASTGRVREQILERIRNGEARTTPLFDFDALPDWVRMAAAVVVMLGLSVWTHREMMADPAGPPALETANRESPARFEIMEGGFQPQLSVTEPSADPLFISQQDPFVTWVANPNPDSPLVFQFTPELTQQIEASFMERTLLETNAVYRNSPLLPVRLEPESP